MPQPGPVAGLFFPGALTLRKPWARVMRPVTNDTARRRIT